jgi:hypothetical protein
MAYCLWSDKGASIHYDEGGKEAKITEGITQEYIILSERNSNTRPEIRVRSLLVVMVEYVE